MTELILIVEDNEDVLFNLKLKLELTGYEVVTAIDGENAVKVLFERDRPPNLIISDIMMPRMDGYDFFKKVSENPKWRMIPFIFLTARTSPEDVRLGKMLGADDYITKPFLDEDLLAIISGKLRKGKQIEEYRKSVENEILTSLQIKKTPSLSKQEKNCMAVLYMEWDDIEGPILKKYHPLKFRCSYSLEDIGFQLFQTGNSIYGIYEQYTAENLLLKIRNIGQSGYIFFDAIDDPKYRSGKKTFMLALLAPQISYFESFEIKEVFKEISKTISECKEWEIKKYWDRIYRILTTPLFNLSTSKN